MASIEFGIDPETLRRRLRALGHTTTRGPKASTYSTKEIARAVVGDLEAERIRDTAASADARELANAQKRGELISAEDMRTAIRERFSPIRTALLSAPTVLAVKCNPSDPHLARTAIGEWVDDVLKVGRGE